MSSSPTEGMYPSIDELMPAWVRVQVPKLLEDIVRGRYEEHGIEYLAEGKVFEGRPVNQCMERDSWKDAEEEIVDAVFNSLVLLFKNAEDERASSAFVHLMAAWIEIKMGQLGC